MATAVACATGTTDGTDDVGLDARDAGEGGSSVSLPDGGGSSSGSTSSGGDGGGSSSSGGTCNGNVVINEIQTGDADPSDEFVEIYNPNDCEVSLSGFVIHYKANTGNSGPDFVTLAGGAKVGAKGYFVIGGAKYTGATQAKTSGGGLAADGGSIALVDGANKTVDAVAWGNATQGYKEGGVAQAAPAGKSIARTPNGTDTNDNAKDFAIASTPTPGAAN